MDLELNDFMRLYADRYAALLEQAKALVTDTKAKADAVLLLPEIYLRPEPKKRKRNEP